MKCPRIVLFSGRSALLLMVTVVLLMGIVGCQAFSGSQAGSSSVIRVGDTYSSAREILEGVFAESVVLGPPWERYKPTVNNDFSAFHQWRYILPDETLLQIETIGPLHDRVILSLGVGERGNAIPEVLRKDPTCIKAVQKVDIREHLGAINSKNTYIWAGMSIIRLRATLARIGAKRSLSSISPAWQEAPYHDYLWYVLPDGTRLLITYRQLTDDLSIPLVDHFRTGKVSSGEMLDLPPVYVLDLADFMSMQPEDPSGVVPENSSEDME